MSDLAIGALSLPALLVLIALRVPIGLAMLAVGFAGTVAVTGSAAVPLARLRTEPFTTFSSYSLSIVPMFLLMGQFATLGGLSAALFRAAEGFLGHRRGGVAMAAVGACAGFGAICGSSLATAATMGRVALPELRAHGYAGGFSAATLAAGGTLGILIPPSVVLVIYAILTEQNIAKLFLAAVLPGVLAALGYMAAIAVYVRVNPNAAGTRARVSWGPRLRALLAVWPALAVFAAVVGGIYGGVFTPTEGAAVGAMGTGLIAWAAGALTWPAFAASIRATARTTAMIFFIVLGAAFLNGFLALTGLPQALAAWVGGAGLHPVAVVVAILVLYLVLGCVMDSLSMILLTVPIVWPVMLELDFGLVALADLQAARLAELVASGAEIPAALLREAEATLAAGDALARETLRELGLRGADAAALARAETERMAIWFGILVLIVVEVGLITPPVGMNLFVIGALDRATPMADTYRAVIYFVAADIARVALLLAFPVLTLALLPL
ncbi:TRAP transporter large permease [Jannaschia sp. W003]|uniref:TRAP transporter large permease n=1 Tax=Jannaschia sp. W003 TaxID=2867012 RepID=UPI0021A3F734|nr:TRAP transporter large permease [Jannaschia sp. W003]UWQ21537.1 TRAP transporter large permease [Jannaschia sp. W003]